MGTDGGRPQGAVFAEVDVAAVAALPDILSLRLKTTPLLQVLLKRGQVALLMLLLDLADAVKQESQLQSPPRGRFRPSPYTSGSTLRFSPRRSLQVGSRYRRDAAQLLEPQLGMPFSLPAIFLKRWRSARKPLSWPCWQISILYCGPCSLSQTRFTDWLSVLLPSAP